MNILKGRENVEAYGLFLDKFCSCVCGKIYYRKNVGRKLLSDWLTPEDEAFARLCLVNSWDSWCDMAEEKAQVRKFRYTSEGKSAAKYKGWNENGIEAYNKILVMVMKDRKERGETFDADFLKEHQEEGKQKAIGAMAKDSAKESVIFSSDTIDLSNADFSEDSLSAFLKDIGGVGV